MRTPKIETPRLILKNTMPIDAKEYSKIGVAYYSTGPLNTEKKARDFIKRSLKRKEGFEWGMFLKETGELIGIVELDHLQWYNFRAGEMSHIIVKKYRGQGYGVESSTALINYCFNKMKLHKIYSDTDPSNIAAQRMLKKLGFKLEGVIRQKNLVKGKWLDEWDYGLLKSDWKTKK